MKKFLSLLLVAAMALSLLSVSALAEEPVKIDMFYQSSRPMNEFTELTRQKVIEDVGVDMNLIQGGDNWKQQLALYITGGDVPDLVAFMDASTFQGYAAEGAFYDLTDLIGNYPNIMAYLSTVSGYTAEDMLKRTADWPARLASRKDDPPGRPGEQRVHKNVADDRMDRYRMLQVQT